MKNLRDPLFAVLTLIMLALTSTPATGAPGEIPAGAVMFFNLGTCPTGWAELAAAQGRYLVGLTPQGTLGQQVGSALRNREERTVSYHTHGVIDPGHSHTIYSVVDKDTGGQSGGPKPYFRRMQYPTDATSITAPGTTGITVQPAGEIRGTTAPYLQLLVCQKQ
jgi:hypothetical protein